MTESINVEKKPDTRPMREKDPKKYAQLKKERALRRKSNSELFFSAKHVPSNGARHCKRCGIKPVKVELSKLCPNQA